MLLSLLLCCSGDPEVQSTTTPLVGDLTVEATEHPLMAQITWTGEPTTAVCTALELEDEVHLVPLLEETTTWTGLLPNTTYTCEAGANNVDFSSGPLPEGFPTWEIEGEVSSGYWTLFDHHLHKSGDSQPRWIAVDDLGRVRWYLDQTQRPEAGIEIEVVDPNTLLVSGGGAVDLGFAPSLWSTSGELLWQAPDQSFTGGLFHHDAIVMPDGMILALTEGPVEKPDGGTTVGVALEGWNPVTNKRMFTWSSQQAVTNGDLPPQPIHANSIQYVEDELGPAIYISAKLIHSIVRLSWPNTVVTHTGGPFMGWELQNEDGESLHPAFWFYSQHAPEYKDGQFLVYDNGLGRAGNDNATRVVLMQWDWENQTATTLQEYSEDDWFEPNWGDADRLPSGNVLIGRGHCWACDDVGQTRSAAIDVNLQTGEVAWRLDFTETKDALYRVDRVAACEFITSNPRCSEQSR